MRSLRLLFIALLVPGLLGSFSTLSRRIAVEKADRNVQIALDLDEVQSLASRPGSPGLTDVLTELKNSGVTSIAVTQSTIGSYLNIGAARLEPVSTDGALRYQIVCDSALISRVIREALRSGGFLSEEPQRRGSSQQGTTIGPLSLPPAEIARLPLGFDTQSQILGQIRRLGFSVVGRVNNFSEVNDSFLGFLAKQMQAFNIEKVIFAGDEVLGWNGGVKQTAEWFERSHLIFGNIEFSKQKGSDKLGTLLKGRYIRVHSISGSEMANYQQPAAVERFVRAARERNVRLLYIRLIEMSGPTALENNASYIHEIVSGLRKSGYRPGAASIIGDPHPLRWELLLMAIALAAGVILVLTEFVDLKPGAAGAAFGITVVVLFAAVFAGDVGRKGLALLSALVFPVWGLARTVRLVNQLPEAVRIPAILRSLQLLVLYLSAIVC
ncbi:MAG: hypothetical protein IT209_06670, partial [Armatimonadetes bacterium]|nr:hypothetical protein [Armatimonadota bacterium]